MTASTIVGRTTGANFNPVIPALNALWNEPIMCHLEVVKFTQPLGNVADFVSLSVQQCYVPLKGKFRLSPCNGIRGLSCYPNVALFWLRHVDEITFIRSAFRNFNDGNEHRGQ